METKAATPEPEPEPAPAPDIGPPCPAVDYAALEPAERHPDTRTIALDRVFRREEARPKTAARPPRVDLGVLPPPRHGPYMKGGGGFGLGWQGLEARWVAGALRPEIEAPFAAWLAVRERYLEHMRGAYLLDTRARYARSVEPPAAWGGRRCIERAAAEAAAARDAAEAEAQEAAMTLQRARAASAPSSSPNTRRRPRPRRCSCS
ncbi:MAG: hypothetical protein H6710_20540 [Myxococcales bacterium]|nr:hypothetical protein [Myxococcales bacterium]